MGSRLFLLCRRLRKGSRFLRGARVYRRAAAAAFAAGLSVSRGPRLSGRCGTSGLPVGVQHAIAFGTHAAEPAVSVFFAPLRRRVSSYGTATHARFLRLLRRAATRSPFANVRGNAGCKVPALGGPQLEFKETKIWIYPATRGRMLGKEIPVSTPKRKLWHIVILLALCTVVAVPSGADDAAPGIVDSQAFLRRNLTPAGPPASASAAAVEKLLARMTLKEKIGQMTQLEIGMVTDGQGQSIRVNSDKLHKAVGEYGVGSILNVNDEALSVEKWHEVIRAIQEEAKKSRLQIPVLYGIDTIHGPNYIVGSTLFPQPLAMAATWNPELMLRGSQI